MSTLQNTGTRTLGFLVLCAAAGCGGTVPEAQAGSEDDVIGGDVTYAHPEVGKVVLGGSLCTGTLVDEDTVITAAHCTGYASRVVKASEGWSFEVQPPAGRASQTFAVDYATVFGTWDASNEPGWRAGDIALLHLKTAVPRALATPAKLGGSWPTGSVRWVVYGYGCTDGQGTGTGTKRRRFFTATNPRGSSPSYLCPGDSGGPLMLSQTGEVFGINSGVIDGHDHFGDVPLHRAALSASAANR